MSVFKNDPKGSTFPKFEMKYCLKKKERFVTIKCGKGVQLAYSKKYTPAAAVSFLQLRNYHVADCILRQKMTNIELWGSLEEGQPKKNSYKLIHPDFIKWWSKVQKSGGVEPAPPSIFKEELKSVKSKDEDLGAEYLPIESEDLNEFNLDEHSGNDLSTDIVVAAKKEELFPGSRDPEENQCPNRPIQLVRLRAGGENNSIPAHLNMKSSSDISGECKKKHAKLQTVIDAANFADVDGSVGMSDSIEIVADKEISGRPMRSDWVDADEELNRLYNIDERIELQKKSVYERSVRVSGALTDCAHYDVLVGITDDESKIKMQDLRSGLETMRTMLKTEYSHLETLQMRMRGEKVEEIYDQLKERGYKPRELVDMFRTGKIPDIESFKKTLSL